METKIKNLINSIIKGHCVKVTITDSFFMSWEAKLSNGVIAYRHDFINWFGNGGTFKGSYDKIVSQLDK
ncbi:MAG: hypothetical protein AABY22_10205 [Nanoarchaeota archaeon]